MIAGFIAPSTPSCRGVARDLRYLSPGPGRRLQRVSDLTAGFCHVAGGYPCRPFELLLVLAAVPGAFVASVSSAGSVVPLPVPLR